MNFKIGTGLVSTYVIILVLSRGLVTSYVTGNTNLLPNVWAAHQIQISNDEVKDTILSIFSKKHIKVKMDLRLTVNGIRYIEKR